MNLPLAVSVLLIQLATLPDTLVTRTIPVRGVFEYTSGVLQIVVLLLGVGVLSALVLLLVALRKGIDKLNVTIERLATDVRPLVQNASAAIDDSRAIVARLRSDVDSVSDAASQVGRQLRRAADRTVERVDDVNAVLDVLQAELEQMAISTVAAARGVSVGSRLLRAVFGRDFRKGARRRSGRPVRKDRDDAPPAD